MRNKSLCILGVLFLIILLLECTSLSSLNSLSKPAQAAERDASSKTPYVTSQPESIESEP